jgi:hypothetical protein
VLPATSGIVASDPGALRHSSVSVCAPRSNDSSNRARIVAHDPLDRPAVLGQVRRLDARLLVHEQRAAAAIDAQQTGMLGREPLAQVLTGEIPRHREFARRTQGQHGLGEQRQRLARHFGVGGVGTGIHGHS